MRYISTKGPISFDLGTADYADYEIMYDNEIIFNGRAFKKPNENSITIEISDIISNYIEVNDIKIEDISIDGGIYTTTLTDQIKQFKLYYSINEIMTLKEVFYVHYDYNEDTPYSRSSLDISTNVPITKNITKNQIIFFNYLSTEADGDEYLMIEVNVNGANVFSFEIFKESFQLVIPIESNYLSEEENIIEIVIDGNKQQEYKINGECENDYYLYYLNSQGAYDSIYVNKASSVSYKNVQSYIQGNYNKGDKSSFEKRMIQNTSTKSFKVNTSLLTDDESKRMNELLNSPKVYLYDINRKETLAVNISDTSYVIKNFNNNKMYNYTINLEFAQKIIRK